MEEIIRFVSLAQTDRFTLTDLCEQIGISRPKKRCAQRRDPAAIAFFPRRKWPEQLFPLLALMEISLLLVSTDENRHAGVRRAGHIAGGSEVSTFSFRQREGFAPSHFGKIYCVIVLRQCSPYDESSPRKKTHAENYRPIGRRQPCLP